VGSWLSAISYQLSVVDGETASLRGHRQKPKADS
jgi:hypothetical protein